jgi:hypothetical protein
MIALDHAIVIVNSLDAAAPVWRRLGFTLTARGRHPGLGTANHTLMFERDYLELLSVEEPAGAARRWAALAARGEGLAMAALATDDARATRRTLLERGVGVGDAIDFGRPVPLPEGPAQARFTVCFPDEAATPALPAFFCQHHTRALVWRSEAQRHANTARGVAGLTVVAEAPEAVAAAWERLLGRARVHPRPGGITLSLGGCQVWVVTPGYAEARLARRLPRDAGPLGITVAVADLGTVRQVLVAGGVPYRDFAARSVLVEPTFTHGVYLEFLAS